MSRKKPPPRALPLGLMLAFTVLEVHGEAVEIKPRMIKGRRVEPAEYEAAMPRLKGSLLRAEGPTMADALVALARLVVESKGDAS